MLYEDGPAILLEATVDDSTAEIDVLHSHIKAKIESQNIAEKEVHKDRNVVFNRICGVKPLLTNPANTALRDTWNSVSSTICQGLTEH